MNRNFLSDVFIVIAVAIAFIRMDAAFAQPLPEQNVVIPLVEDGIAIYDPALNVLMAMQIAGCAKLDITPVNYTWTATNDEGCKQ